MLRVEGQVGREGRAAEALLFWGERIRGAIRGENGDWEHQDRCDGYDKYWPICMEAFALLRMFEGPPTRRNKLEIDKQVAPLP